MRKAFLPPYKKKNHFDKLGDVKNWQKIEMDTRNQSESEL
jgi:hypothetical protein